MWCKQWNYIQIRIDDIRKGEEKYCIKKLLIAKKCGCGSKNGNAEAWRMGQLHFISVWGAGTLIFFIAFGMRFHPFKLVIMMEKIRNQCICSFVWDGNRKGFSSTSTPKMWCEKNHYNQPREKWIGFGIHTYSAEKSYLSIDILRAQRERERESWCYVDKCDGRACASANVYMVCVAVRFLSMFMFMFMCMCIYGMDMDKWIYAQCTVYRHKILQIYTRCVVNRSQAILKANTHHTYTILPPDRHSIVVVGCVWHTLTHTHTLSSPECERLNAFVWMNFLTQFCVDWCMAVKAVNGAWAHCFYSWKVKLNDIHAHT